MNIRIKRILTAVSISILLPLGAMMPAYAESGSHSHETSKPAEVTSDSTTTRTKKTEVEVEHAKEQENEAETENHDQAKKILEEAKKTGKEHSKEERLKNCTEKQQGLENKLSNIQKNSAKHLAKIDSVLLKITDAQATATTPVDAALVTAATNAQVQATASVAALANLNAKIVCSKDTAASEISTFKAASTQAKTDLKAYRDAVKAILKAIETLAGDN